MKSPSLPDLETSPVYQASNAHDVQGKENVNLGLNEDLEDLVRHAHPGI